VANPYALGAVGLAVALQIAALHVDPLPALLGVVPLAPGEWAIVVSLSALPAVVGQGIKSWRPHL
jgi:hypothetical protein